MLRKRYQLDKENLLFKRVRLTFKEKLIRFSLALTISLLLALAYGLGFKSLFGSPKQYILETELKELQFKFELLQDDFNRIDESLIDIALAENNIYRPVLDMDTLAQSFRMSGFGGSKRYEELEGYLNSNMMISASRRLNELERKTYVQSKSFEDIIPGAEDWKNKLDHLPWIQPVKVTIPLGEGVKFRDDHPVLHVSRWHYGQDFRSPNGTEVIATGSGVVTKAAWTPYGFGNRVEIDHGYGFKTIYAHLSEFFVEPGHLLQRGDLIALSGSTGISSGPHLHYEIHYNGKVQNPLYFFNDDLTLMEWNNMIQVLESDSLR
jgi:murein DD-endopeptidase MepM/ murein hydrolase activator NlpD